MVEYVFKYTIDVRILIMMKDGKTDMEETAVDLHVIL